MGGHAVELAELQLLLLLLLLTEVPAITPYCEDNGSNMQPEHATEVKRLRCYDIYDPNCKTPSLRVPFECHFGVAILPVGALYLDQVHVGRTVVPK